MGIKSKNIPDLGMLFGVCFGNDHIRGLKQSIWQAPSGNFD